MTSAAPDDDVAQLLAALPGRISDVVTRNAARIPDAEALREDGQKWTYAELDAASARTARALREAGVRGGDRVLLVAENCAALVAVLLALARLDAWAVLVNARLSAREVDAIRDHCAPRRTVYFSHVSPDAAAHALRHGYTLPWPLGTLGEATLGAANDSVKPEPVHDDPARQVAALLYTTGTTGEPKGVMLSHRNLLFIARVSSMLRRLAWGDRVYGVLPITHVYGLASVCLGTLFSGACLRLAARFSPEAMLRSLAKDGITVAQGVPAMYARLLDVLPAGAAPAAPRLRFLYAGGSPLDPTLKSATEAAFGLTLHNGYGLTESSPTVTQTRIDAPRSDCSVGTAIPGVDMRIVDDNGRALPDGETGVLHVRGPNVMLGYYRNPTLTAAAITADGWLDTGDLARRDADGALFIVGRVKELIIRSGFNVHPAEVEAVLNSHPAVLQSAVVGRPVMGNEEVVAFVELTPGLAATTADLARHASAHLAPYKRPAKIVIMPALPASATGKILKHRLRIDSDAG